MFHTFAELFGTVGGHERVDHLVEIAVENILELIERQTDAMIGESALRIIIGADALAAVPVPT